MDINEKFSVMTLGTVQLGLEYGIANKTGKPSAEVAFEILKTALDGGINSFDTSIEYGDSEKIIGDFLNANEHIKKPFISTKFKLPPETKDSDAAIEKKMFSLCEKSLQRLRIDKIPLYMLHTPQDMTRFGKIVPKTMRKLISEGYIQSAGVSVYTVDEAKEMMKDDVYTSIQLPMNVFDSRFIKSGMIKILYDNNINVFVRSVFLQGLFFIDPDEVPSNFKTTSYYLKLLHDFSIKENIDIAQLAFSYISGIKGVSSIVLGAETKKQISENIALSSSRDIDQDKRKQLEMLFKDAPIDEIMLELKKKYDANRIKLFGGQVK